MKMPEISLRDLEKGRMLNPKRTSKTKLNTLLLQAQIFLRALPLHVVI